MPARRGYGGAVGRVGTFLSRFYRKAYEENVTGLSAMVAYNLLLSVLPLALLALFIAGRLFSGHSLEDSVVRDLERLFPHQAQATLRQALENVRNSSTKVGIAALVSSLWVSSSFWGSLDTAFCRIYQRRCRSWVEQKRFALAMLAVVLLFMAATVAVPALQSVLATGASNLPFGLDKLHGLVLGASLGAAGVVLFGLLCLIYRVVPNCPIPWHATWPGALAATIAVGIVDIGFPLYLENVSSVNHVGTTLVFIVIVLVWFYVLAIILLGGAVVNALRLGEGPRRELAGD
jgi:membrane protein